MLYLVKTGNCTLLFVLHPSQRLGFPYGKLPCFILFCHYAVKYLYQLTIVLV